jgi:hypothetical protein
MNAPYTESQRYAISLGENFPHRGGVPCERGGVPCGRALHVVSYKGRTASPAREKMCVSEKAGFFLISSHSLRSPRAGAVSCSLALSYSAAYPLEELHFPSSCEGCFVNMVTRTILTVLPGACLPTHEVSQIIGEARAAARRASLAASDSGDTIRWASVVSGTGGGRIGVQWRFLPKVIRRSCRRLL